MIWGNEPFTSTRPGIVPASGGVSTNFLAADGTWSVPAGTFAGITVYLESIADAGSPYLGVNFTDSSTVNFTVTSGVPNVRADITAEIMISVEVV